MTNVRRVSALIKFKITITQQTWEWGHGALTKLENHQTSLNRSESQGAWNHVTSSSILEAGDSERQRAAAALLAL